MRSNDCLYLAVFPCLCVIAVILARLPSPMKRIRIGRGMDVCELCIWAFDSSDPQRLDGENCLMCCAYFRIRTNFVFVIKYKTVVFVADPSITMWFGTVAWYWDQARRQRIYGWRSWSSGMQSARCVWRGGAKRRLQRRSVKRKCKWGIKLRQGRLGRKKLECVHRAKAAIEENPDALRKEKWPRCPR